MRKSETIHVLSMISVMLLAVITLCGMLSWDTSRTYDTVNQYGETIRMWGNGIYTHDSYLKATIFIGSDMCMLFMGIPLTVLSVINDLKKKNKHSRLLLVSVLAWVLYYAVSLCFGVTYNSLFLV